MQMRLQKDFELHYAFWTGSCRLIDKNCSYLGDFFMVSNPHGLITFFEEEHCGHKRLRRQRTPKAHCVFWQPISLIVFLQPFLSWLDTFSGQKPKQIVDMFIHKLN